MNAQRMQMTWRVQTRLVPLNEIDWINEKGCCNSMRPLQSITLCWDFFQSWTTTKGGPPKCTAHPLPEAPCSMPKSMWNKKQLSWTSHYEPKTLPQQPDWALGMCWDSASRNKVISSSPDSCLFPHIHMSRMTSFSSGKPITDWVHL